MDEWTETGRGFINTWECDENEHLNVQFFVAKKDEADAHLRLALGLAPFNVGGGVHVRRDFDHIRFHGELRIADMVAMRSGIVDWQTSHAIVVHELRRLPSLDLCATFRARWQAVDGEGNVRAWLDASASRAAPLRVALPEDAAPRSVGKDDAQADPTLADAEGLMTTYRGIVLPDHCDATGTMTPRYHMARFSDAAAHVWTAAGVDYAQSWTAEVGTVALEDMIHYRRPLRSGDALVIKSYIREVARKTLGFNHLLFDAASGKLAAIVEVTSAMFDLKGRRVLPLDYAVRRRLERQAVKFA